MIHPFLSWSSRLAILVIWSLAFTACTNTNQTVSPSPESQPSVANHQGAEGRTITHAMGTTEIKGTPKRIVVLTNEATDNVLALGVEPVGAVKSWFGNPYYEYIEPQMQEVPVVGEELQPNLEKIAALNPDLILGSKVRHEQVYSQLSAIAPTVYSETLGADWKENLMLYAQALNREPEAQKILADWNQQIANLKAKLGDRINQEISLVRFIPGVARINYEDNFAGRILKEIGFQRPPAQRKDEFATQVTLEQIPQMDGDVLFYMTFKTEEGEATELAKTWTTHPLWQNLEAVKQNQAYEVNDIYWNTAGGVQAANRMLDDLNQFF